MTWSDILIMKWKLGWKILGVEILNVTEEYIDFMEHEIGDFGHGYHLALVM